MPNTPPAQKPLYQQFDERCRQYGAVIMTDHCCSSVLNAIGGLLALGWPPVQVEEFLAQSLKNAIATVKAPAQDGQQPPTV